MLKIIDLTIETEEVLLYSVDLQLELGTIYGLSGYNGSGKTTLLRTLAGIRYEKQGRAELEVAGKILMLGDEKRQLFYFETSDWFEGHLSGKDYLNLISGCWNQGSAQAEIAQVIEFWGIKAFIHKPIKKYSLGMKQKLLLALYKVSNADYWLMDEPTIGLDAASCETFAKFLRQAKEQGKTILFSSHQNDSMYEICDYTYQIKEKNLVLVENSKKEDR